jgi:hypothetical protein
MDAATDLREKYPDGDFTRFPGDQGFRYKAFAPLFENLYENNMLYHEHAVGWLIQVEELEITPEKFEATACPLCIIYDNHRRGGTYRELKKWKFGARWDWMMFGYGVSFHVPYAAFTIFLEEERIKRIEKLVAENRLDETYNVVWEEEVRAWENREKYRNNELL